MESESVTARYCVIGAGASGLAVAKNFKEQGLDFDVFERHAEVGGLWGYGRPYSAVYQSTRLISSKPMTEFRGFPMDPDLPDYPGHADVFRYMKAYADHFGLRENIRFDTEVVSATRSGSDWDVKLRSGEVRSYR
ncbi:MAG: NAD(P)-binding protein, partial [Gammaproteobacteria bacterium]